MELSNLPEIPKSWLIALMMIFLCVMRMLGIDTFVTSGLSLIIGFLVGKETATKK